MTTNVYLYIYIYAYICLQIMPRVINKSDYIDNNLTVKCALISFAILFVNIINVYAWYYNKNSNLT